MFQYSEGDFNTSMCASQYVFLFLNRVNVTMDI